MAASVALATAGGGVADATNYVVIGAFTIEEHAEQHSVDAKKYNLVAQHDYNPLRNLYYVYILKTDSKKEAFEKAQHIRETTSFTDTWVYHGVLGRSEIISSVQGVEMNNTKGSTTVKEEENITSVAEVTEEITSDSITSDVNKEIPKPAKTSEQKKEGIDFYFEILSASTQKIIDGDIDLVDLDKNKKIASYHGNESVELISVNKSGKVSLECDKFGYRKTIKQFNFQDIAASNFVVNDKGENVARFEMVRLVKGDISVMYNVYFFKDAAIMRPESKYEITSLLEMMNENPNYRIKIHGHTNGGASGKIITMQDKGDYFSLSNSNEGYGSAKKLSLARSETMKNFLLDQGILEGRIEIKGWGGKRPIHDKRSARANENVRVEIEILQN